MTIGGTWKLVSWKMPMIAPRREVIVLNLLRHKPLTAWEIWTKAQRERPPLDWEDIEKAMLALAKNGNIIRVKETE